MLQVVEREEPPLVVGELLPRGRLHPGDALGALVMLQRRRLPAQRRGQPGVSGASPSGSSKGTMTCCFFLKRLAMVRLDTPRTQAANGASPRKEPREVKTLMKTSWIVSSASAWLAIRRFT